MPAAASSAPAGKIDLEGAGGRAIDVNLTGAFLTVGAALADMTRAQGGRIVFIASTAGLKGYPYVARLRRRQARRRRPDEGAEPRVRRQEASRSTRSAPGSPIPPLLDAAADKISAKTGRSADHCAPRSAKDNAHGRLITPEEVADTVLWLCSPGVASINGQAIAVTGGPPRPRRAKTRSRQRSAPR